MRPVGRATLEPILFLLESPDIEVQRAASAALGNLAVDGTHAQLQGFFGVLVLTSGQARTRCSLFLSAASTL